MKPAKASSGFMDALRAIADGILGTVQERVALLALELEEEKLRLIGTLVRLALVGFFGVLAMLCATAAVVVHWWNTAPVTALVGCALGYLIVAIGVSVTLVRFLADQPKPLESTRAEIEEDRACIQSDD